MRHNGEYPKVLIIGQTFEKTTGGGITLSKLFSGWKRDRVAIASTNIDLTQTSNCTNFYQIGNDEEQWIFPFNRLQRKVESGPITFDKRSTGYDNANGKTHIFTRPKRTRLREFLKDTFLSSVRFFGVYHLLYGLSISERFIAWVEDFKPDIIYSQLSSLELIRFVSEVQEIIEKPIAIHIMDDWPQTVENKGIVRFYFNKRIDTAFRKIMEKAYCLMCICPEMSDAYQKRYNKFFHPFHNPVDLSVWERVRKEDLQIVDPLNVVYAGRIGTANQDSILDICRSISALNKDGLGICFDIYTPDYAVGRRHGFARLQGVTVHPSIPHKDIPSLLTKADLLVIPLDFDEMSIRFARYSMPGKTSEYMASGTPILVYAPERTALSMYAKREKWGYSVNRRDVTILCEAFRQLYTNRSLREQYGKHARQVAFDNHDAMKVRERFRRLLCAIPSKDVRE